ncbi:MAG: hypothetical protein ATN35_02910 [Epulopiscium sp. Nele67-Bin004]|nr:MAG: hypothetical protein ATN35_02910 [Epulopiscium sp. Nele67-Bin004]
MRNIVETIQQEQNDIIRNKSNDLLIVQGVAGSGKTSIAMHRIAFLLYNHMDAGLSHKDVMILSPNSLFGEYISEVLPELGEKNVISNTLEDLYKAELRGSARMDTKNRHLELMISSKNRNKMWEEMEFKGSYEFITILDRYLDWIENEGMEFEDILYNDKLVMEKDEFRAHFLDNQIGMSTGSRLARIERILIDRLRPLEIERRAEIEEMLIQQGGFDYEEDKEAQRRIDELRGKFISYISKYTRNNFLLIYINLVKDFEHFQKFSEGVELPKSIKGMLAFTTKRLSHGLMSYVDGAVMLYIKLKLEGSTNFSKYRQVVIDEAQDYYPIHYYIFKMLFKNSHYTVLGDYGQTIEKTSTDTVYDDAIKILEPKKPLRIDLTKSYRSSYEINNFISNLRGDTNVTLAFERHEEKPSVMGVETEEQLQQLLLDEVEKYKAQNFARIVVLCKDKVQVKLLKESIGTKLIAQYVLQDDVPLKHQVTVMPSYMSKGLEYDAVIVYDANDKNYVSQFDKQLLYVSCSRALHRLSVLYKGVCTKYIK